MIGLSPNHIGAKSLEGFLSQINNGKILDPIFSFYLSKGGQAGSAVTFGGYNAEKFAKEGKDIQWLDLDPENNNYWSLPMEPTISFGETKNLKAKISSTNAILDSGLSYALVPSRDVKVLSQLVKDQSKIDCKAAKGEEQSNVAFYHCESCSEANLAKVPSLHLNLGGKDFVMPRQSFIRPDDSGLDTCKLLLTSSDMDTSGSRSASGDFFGDSGSQNWLLGDQFL